MYSIWEVEGCLQTISLNLPFRMWETLNPERKTDYKQLLKASLLVTKFRLEPQELWLTARDFSVIWLHSLRRLAHQFIGEWVRRLWK